MKKSNFSYHAFELFFPLRSVFLMQDKNRQNYGETVPFPKFPHDEIRWNYGIFCKVKKSPTS